MYRSLHWLYAGQSSQVSHLKLHIQVYLIYRRLSSRLSPNNSSDCLTHSFAMPAISSSSSSSSERTGKHSGSNTMYSSPIVSIMESRQLTPAFLTSVRLWLQASSSARLRGFHNCSFPAAVARADKQPATLP